VIDAQAHVVQSFDDPFVSVEVGHQVNRFKQLRHFVNLYFSPQRHREHREINFLDLPGDGGKS
jgi:hypothetical protein